MNLAKTYKILLIVFLLGALLIYNLNSNHASEALGLEIDGQKIDFEQSREPFIISSTTYVPLTEITDTLGAEVFNNDDGSIATIIYKGIVIDITENTIMKYDKTGASNLYCIPIVQDESVFLPVRALFEAIGYNITWDEKTKTISAMSADSNQQDIYKYGEIQQSDFSYSGVLRNEVPDIRGKITFNSGTIYKGQISQAIISGSGIEVYQDGDSFIGTFTAGRRNGAAEYRDANQSTIFGTWQSGSLVGEVTVLYYNGSKYVGTLTDGKREGTGTFTFANGDTYTGSWSADQYEGSGLYNFTNGASYKGKWKDGKLNGVVIYKSSSGELRCIFNNGEVTAVE
jgi:hypothetical protein